MNAETLLKGTTGALAEMMMEVPSEKKLDFIRSVLETGKESPEEKLLKAKVWIDILAGNKRKIAALEVEDKKKEVKVEPVRKYNRIPFDKKMEIINYSKNNKVTYRQLGDIFGIPEGTARSIVTRYNNKNKDKDVPEVSTLSKNSVVIL